MEDVLQLTRNLVLAKEDSNDSTEGDQNCNELLARMLDLGQTCQKVNSRLVCVVSKCHN